MGTPHAPAWGEGVGVYLERYGELHHAPATRKKVGRILRAFGELISGKALTEILRSDFETYQLARKTAGMAPATINQHVRHLKAFLEWCVGEGWIVSNPGERVKMLRLVKSRRFSISIGTLTEFLRWLDARGQGFYADLLRLIANTGLRSGEALHLRPPDVDFDARLVWTMVRAEYSTKDREERRVPLNDVALKILRRRVMAAGGGPLFLQTTGRGKGKIPHVTSIAHAVTRLAERANIPGLTCQTLRQFFGTTNASIMPEIALAAIMGHESIETTRKHYIEAARVNLPTPPAIG